VPSSPDRSVDPLHSSAGSTQRKTPHFGHTESLRDRETLSSDDAAQISQRIKVPSSFVVEIVFDRTNVGHQWARQFDIPFVKTLAVGPTNNQWH
jgi:hypothetical protein